MRSTLAIPVLFASLAFLGGTAMAEDTVPNPEYQNWSSFKVGASATLAMTSQSGETTTTTKMTTKLLELTEEKAVVETAMTMTVGGKDMEMPAQKRDVPAKVAKTEPSKEAPPKTTEGDEDVTVGDQKIACHWVEVTIKNDTMTMTSKTWTSKSVPGGTVKMESTTDMAGTKSTTKSMLTSFTTGA